MSDYEHWKEMAVRGNSATERYPTSGHLPIEGTTWTEEDADDDEGSLMAKIVSAIIAITLLALLLGYLLSFEV